MGIFGSIKDAIFGKDEEKAPAATTKPVVVNNKAAATKAAMPKAISEVDVEARLDAMSGGDKLNWRGSIVDLMKAVGLDPSYENRKALANELGDTDYSGKAEENIVLHKQVMSALAKNGGKVPAKLRD